MALYCLLTAAHITAISKPTVILRERPYLGASRWVLQNRLRSVRPMLEQKLWIHHILPVVESQERFFWVKDFVFLFCSRFCLISVQFA